MILTPEYVSPKIPELIHKHKRHREILDKLIHARKWQNTLFLGGLFLFNFKKYREKAINLLG